MSGIPDYALGSTLDFPFPSRSKTGASIAPVGATFACRVGDGTTANITAGITATISVNTVVGDNNVRIVATAGNGFAAGETYHVVFTAGTVDGESVVGQSVGTFTLEKTSALMPTVDGNKVAVSGTAIDAVGTTASVQNLTGGAITAASFAAAAITEAAIAAQALANRVWSDPAARTVTGSTTALSANVTFWQGVPAPVMINGFPPTHMAEAANNAIDSNVIAAGALNGKGDWNIGKTGYDLNADQSIVTVGTATNLTNLPTIPNNWLTEAGIADTAFTSSKFDPRMARAIDAIGFGTVGPGATTTSIPTSALNPAVGTDADQFRGRIITFAHDTATANLRSKSSVIQAVDTGGTITVDPLLTAPASGDIFSIQ